MVKIAVGCIIFRQNYGSYEFLLLKRIPSKGGFWQYVVGGVERTDKSTLAAAYREVNEETGISSNKIIQVIENIHSFEFSNDYLTGKPAEIIKEHVFAFEVQNGTFVSIDKNTSFEHEDYEWASYEESQSLLKWQENKDAFAKLWVLLNKDH
jgi:8-oxo-dGTP pyrophosphatase MutT (NUDIX family)